MCEPIRNLSLVKLKSAFSLTQEMPFLDDMPFIFLGEIPNLPEHGVFIGKSGQIYSGLHIFEFEELSEEEI